MTTKSGSEMKRDNEQLNEGLYREGNPSVHGLGEWIEWRAQKLQTVRQEIIGKAQTTRNPDFTNRAQAASRG